MSWKSSAKLHFYFVKILSSETKQLETFTASFFYIKQLNSFIFVNQVSLVLYEILLLFCWFNSDYFVFGSS
jgi:hypothetical protein